MSASPIAADWLLTASGAPSVADPLTGFYSAADEGVLELAVCVAHGHPLDADQVRCDRCGAAAEARAVAPQGRVLAVVTMHRREAGLVATDAPYPVLDVELDSGHRLYLSTTDGAAPVPAVGARVRVGWVRIGPQAVPRVSNDMQLENRSK